MDRIKVEEFKGLYTNSDEAKLNPAYQTEAINVRFRTGYVESEGYNISQVSGYDNVLYTAPVKLDNDKLHNVFNEYGELTNDYQQSYTDYLMIVKKYNDTKSQIILEPTFPLPASSGIVPNSPLTSDDYPCTLYSPADGNSNSLPCIFNYGRTGNPWINKYKLQFSTMSGNNFDDNIFFEVLTDPSSFNSSRSEYLLTNSDDFPTQVFYWRVLGRYTDPISGGETWTQPSETWQLTITVVPNEIEIPVLISPTNGQTNVTFITFNDIDYLIPFEWSFVARDGYIIQVAKDEEFSDLTFNIVIPNSDYNLANLALQGLTKYYWRVATKLGNSASAWSEVWSFTTEERIVVPSESTLYEFTKVYKHLNLRGEVLLVTDNGMYWIGKIDRTHLYSGYSTPPIIPGIFIVKYIPSGFQINLILNTIESVSPNTKIGITLEIVSVETVIEELGGSTARSIHHTVNAYYPDRYVRGTYKLSEIYRKIGEEWVYTETIYPTEFSTDILRVDGDDWYNHRNEKVLSWINVPVESKIVFDDADRFSGTEMEVVATYTFDEKNEYVYGYKKISSTSSSYFLKASNLLDTLPLDIQKDPRISGISLYAKTNSSDDFQQLMFIPLLAGKPVPYSNDFYFTERHYNGFFLSQTIGTVYSRSTYKPISDFTDYLEIQGIAYGIYNKRVYSPAIGKGQIMNGVFYDYIPEVEGEFLSDVNDTLGVFSEKLQLINVVDSKEGYLLFAPKDKMNFMIRDLYDLGTSPEGIIIHTKRGIYVTNGYERKLISEEINDIVEKNFTTGNIYYSLVYDILFYFNSNGSYKYDFVYGQWSEVRIKSGRQYVPITGRLTFDDAGSIYAVNNGTISMLVLTNDAESIIRTPNVDLDYPMLAKNIIYVDLDFEGQIRYGGYNITHTKRKVARVGVPVSQRTPNALIGTRLNFIGKVYTIDIYYDIVGEFRNADYLPPWETSSEGIQQDPKFFEGLI